MPDSNQLTHFSELETPKIKKEKDSLVLLNEKYNTPNTSLLLFHFEPFSYKSSDLRLKDCLIEHTSIEDKDIYLFDRFFLGSEGNVMRLYSRQAKFSRSSYASQESKEKGEDPAYSMNNREKWDFFSHPPQPIKEIYKLLGMLSNQINAEISTLPWDICDKNICASAVATNKLERVSNESMKMGKHEDFNTEKGIPFGIPILYSKEKAFFPPNFSNGAEGNPWLISFMLYVTEDNFIAPNYGIGTIFYKKNEQVAFKADCIHMRFVLFEGDIIHSIEESKIPKDIKTWRVSYVFKLLINPKNPNDNMKKAVYELLRSYTKKL